MVNKDLKVYQLEMGLSTITGKPHEQGGEEFI